MISHGDPTKRVAWAEKWFFITILEVGDNDYRLELSEFTLGRFYRAHSGMLETKFM